MERGGRGGSSPNGQSRIEKIDKLVGYLWHRSSSTRRKEVSMAGESCMQDVELCDEKLKEKSRR